MAEQPVRNNITPFPVVLGAVPIHSSLFSPGGSYGKNIGGGAVDFLSDSTGLIPPTVFFLNLIETAGAVAYVQIYSKMAASVTVGATVPDAEFRLNANESKIVPVAFTFGFTGFDGGGNSIAAISMSATASAGGGGAAGAVWVTAFMQLFTAA
jgi:hypothetical protein